MARRTYSPEYKAKLVIEVLLSPNILRNWKAEFLENDSRAFDGSRQAKEARRKEADLKETQAQMLRKFSFQIRCGPSTLPTSKCSTGICT